MLHHFVFSSQIASEEELKRLEKEVREQEQLLTGYQQENERLYKELKQLQAKEKANEARMFSENQKLGNNVRFAPLLNTRLWEWFGYSYTEYKRYYVLNYVDLRVSSPCLPRVRFEFSPFLHKSAFLMTKKNCASVK